MRRDTAGTRRLRHLPVPFLLNNKRDKRSYAMNKEQHDHCIIVWAKMFLLACAEHREVWSIDRHRPYRASVTQ